VLVGGLLAVPPSTDRVAGAPPVALRLAQHES